MTRLPVIVRVGLTAPATTRLKWTLPATTRPPATVPPTASNWVVEPSAVQYTDAAEVPAGTGRETRTGFAKTLPSGESRYTGVMAPSPTGAARVVCSMFSVVGVSSAPGGTTMHAPFAAHTLPPSIPMVLRVLPSASGSMRKAIESSPPSTGTKPCLRASVFWLLVLASFASAKPSSTSFTETWMR
jgi:hypothetical protein